MKCPDEFMLSVYADGELPTAQSSEIAMHLDECALCREQARLFEAESRWLARSLQAFDAETVEVEAVGAVRMTGASAPAAARSVWRLGGFVVGAALGLALILEAVSSFRLPAGFGWLDPSGIQGQLAILVNAFFYLIEEGIPMITAIVSGVSLALLNLVILAGVVVMILRRGIRIPAAGMLAGLMLVVAAPGEAIDIRSVENGAVTIGADEVVDDTLVVFAQSVNIDGVVTGSVIAFALEVNVRGNVQGNVIAGARRITVDGVVEGDVFSFAQTVTTAGRLNGNLWAFNESLIVDDEADIAGNATVFGADGNIEGRVGRDLTMFGAILNVGGLVERRVNFSGNRLIIRGPAVIGGDVSATVPAAENVQVDAAAVISGSQSIELREPREFNRFGEFARVGFYLRQLLRIVTAFVVGLLLFWALPALARVDLGDARMMAASGGIGFLALVATPVAAIVLAITLIGLPLAFLTGVTWLMGLYLAKIMVAQFIGAAVIGRKANGVSTGPGLLLGVAAVVVAVNMPFVGGVINFILMLLGLGALVVGLYWLISGKGPEPRATQTPA